MESVMSVQPRPWPQPAPEIVAAVAVMYRGKRERPLPVVVRDQLGEWLSDEQFAGACGTRGKPGWPPGRLALVTVFQMAEDLTGRQAAEAVRTRIGWKYALGLDLADPGFDGSVLSEFRARCLLERLAAGGLVPAGGKMRTDSTHVVAAVRDLSRLELAGEAVRAWRRWRWPRRTGWPVTGTARAASGTPRGPAPGGCPPPRRGKTRSRWPAAATAAPC
jgi:hypothetical protein